MLQSTAQSKKNRWLRTGAFTLIELLVVISIIALLISILLPALSSAQKSAKRLACMSQLKQAQLAIEMYANDNQRTSVFFTASSPRWCTPIKIGYYYNTGTDSNPAGGDSWERLNTKMLHCPSNPGPIRAFLSYSSPVELTYRIGSFAHIDDKLDSYQDDFPLLADARAPSGDGVFGWTTAVTNHATSRFSQTGFTGWGDWHLDGEGVNVLYADGRIDWQRFEDLETDPFRDVD